MTPVLETRRMQPTRIKALAAFQAATCWIYGCLLGAESVDQHLQVISRGEMDPGMRDQVDEAVVACVRSLDPIAESAARQQARMAALERLDVLQISGPHDPERLRERAFALADAVLSAYRGQLIYGSGGRS